LENRFKDVNVSMDIVEVYSNILLGMKIISIFESEGN